MIYDMPEQMQDQWAARLRLRRRQRSAIWLMVAAAAFFVLMILWP